MFPNKDCIDCPDCPEVIPAVPIPDLSHVCGSEYDLSCVKYTGPNIPCLEIFSGTMMDVVLAKFNTALAACDCCHIPVVDCVVSAWSAWGPEPCITCTPATGGGTECTQTRTRTIITDASGGGTPCPVLTETRTVCCPVNCVYNYTYTTCSPAGTRTGTLVITTPASCGGTPCPSATTITENCIPDIDCVMSDWTAWGTCTGGVERRTRTVVTPQSGNGAACGPTEEIRTNCQPPPFCFPVSAAGSRLITVCTQYLHTIEYYSCNNCTPAGITVGLKNFEKLTKDYYYYDPIAKQKFRVISYNSCDDSAIDRNIEATDGFSNCSSIICPCSRPTGLLQARLLLQFTTNDASPCDPAQTYNVLNAGSMAAACALFERFKTCICPGNVISTGFDDVEYANLALGEKIYRTFGSTICDMATPGFYFFWNNITLLPQDYFCTVNNITIIQVGADGKIIDINTTCNSCTSYKHVIDIYSCGGGGCSVPIVTGINITNSEQLTINSFYYDPLLQQKVKVISYGGCDNNPATKNILASSGNVNCGLITCPACTTRPTGLIDGVFFHEFSASAGGSGCTAIQDIKNAPNLAAACTMWNTFKSCICTYGLNDNALYQAQHYPILEKGQKIYVGHTGTTHCGGLSAGKYFFVEGIDLTDVVPYLCAIPTVTVVTVVTGGIISAVETCTFACARPGGTFQSKLLRSFTCSGITHDITASDDIAEACAIFTNLKTCGCPNAISAFTKYDIELTSMVVGQKVWLGLGSDCDFVPAGIYFWWQGSSTVPQEYFCNTNMISIITIDSGGIITNITNCTYP